MDNEFNTTEMVNAKWFMRDIAQYNDLNRFLNELWNYCVEIVESPGLGPGEQFDYSLIDDAFFPLTPLSDCVYIEVSINDKTEDKRYRYNRSLVRSSLGLSNNNLKLYTRTPNWGYWSRLEFWTTHETAYLLFYEEPELVLPANYGNTVYPIKAVDCLDKLIDNAFCAGELAGFRKENGETQIYTRKGNLGAWLKKMGFVAPEELKDTIGENEIVSSDVTEEEAAPLTGPESRELGRLRQERGKWESAIKAAVHVTHEITGKITRGELKDKVYKHDLPDTTIETIWQALRDRGLTKGAGRPKNTK